MTVSSTGSRSRAYLQFVAAVVVFFLARIIARRCSLLIFNELWEPLAERVLFFALLLLGYARLGAWFNKQAQPVAQQGWPGREGWPSEFGLGAAYGWALALLCVLPSIFAGGVAVAFNVHLSAFVWLLYNALLLAFASLAEEVAFRGYGFQRFVDAVGATGAALGFAIFYTIVQSLLPGSTRASLCTAFVLGLILSAAYLRTRALWLSLGLNFAWKASRALLFGATLGGFNLHPAVIQGDPMGPLWVTGGGYGLESSWITVLLLIAAWPFVFSLTRALSDRYNSPEIVAAGIPVDVEALRRRQQEAVAPAAAPLVQILPVESSGQTTSAPTGVNADQEPPQK
jgi:membrane protease YdiL (CAAX protease family)